MPRHTLAVLALVIAATSARAQSGDAAPEAKPDAGGGVISGVVLSDGQPVFNADVQVYASGGGWQSERKTVATDEDGKFRAEGLGQLAFVLEASAPGYVADDDAPRSTGFHYAGDIVTLRITKGAVLTGKVTRANGEPVIATQVRAMRLRDGNGRRVEADWNGNDATDDRGVYRIYGLQSGTYVVCAGGSAPWGGRDASFTSDDAPTYYPSASFDGATEVTLRSGQEASGLDIVYRGERGHKASGVVVGAEAGRAWIQIRSVSPSAEISSTSTERLTGKFEFAALADGEYELSATKYGDEETEAAAPPVTFKVRGADVTGLRVVLAPVATIAGKVVLAGQAAADSENPCPEKSTRTVTEVVVSVYRDAALPGRSSFGADSTSADKTGAFVVKGLLAARYRLSPRLPDVGWYLQSILRTEAGRKAPVDVKRDGLSVGAGQDMDGITITISAGAARVSGRVTPENEGGSLPDVVRVHLVPAEADAGEASTRFYEIETERDGTFELKNIAPGAYRAIAVADPPARDDDPPHRPASWDQTSRAALRKAAAALPEITLAPCAVQKDLALRLSVSAPSRAGR